MTAAMDSLYSRYVPPKKKQKIDSAPPPSIAATERISTPVEYVMPTKSDASSTYKRYVPPTKSRKSSSTAAPGSAGDSNILIDRKSVAGNGENGHVRARRMKDEAVNHDALAVQTDPMDLDTAATSQRKEKRREKLALEPKVSAGLPAEGEKEYPKHASILARREKSLRNAEELARKAAKKTFANNQEEDDEDVEVEGPAELHALEPLPQPEPLPESAAKPSFSSLPVWLASPIKISPTATASFSDLGVRESAISVLGAKGFNEAFAVQAAVLPLLLPGPRQQPGDVLVSAATGSGKTLAYVLPMVEDISKSLTNRLSGLIVMPTRELVSQAKDVCDTCAIAFSHNRKHVKTGIALGSQNLEKEQATLMDREQFRDPLSYQEEEDRRIEWKIPGSQPDEDEDEDEAIYLLEDEYIGGVQDVRLLRESTSLTLQGDDLGPRPKVNILVCTPGRLVEHIKSTPGFTLQYLKWLVIDEADKLLNQSFQEWVETIMHHLPSEVTKIILSATMTRDVGQLSSLKLYRPKLVVLESERSEDQDLDAEEENGKTLALPATLHETAIKVDEEADKPLYLLELLKSQKMIEVDSEEVDETFTSEDSSSSDEDTSSSDSEEDCSTVQPNSRPSTPKLKSSMRQSLPTTKSRGVLIFTKSNENALRLSRLLTLIDPTFANALGTLTSTIPMTTRRKTLTAFQSGKISVLVASDLVSRGLDLPSLAHVVNYDMPSSLSSYVHRIGRTARAGKTGNAWTLFTNTEARWFWNEIARSALVDRDARKVARFRIDAESFGDALRSTYEKNLEMLGQEARGQK